MIAQWCRIHRHQPIAEQHRTLSQKLRGHYAYYGITGNPPWADLRRIAIPGGSEAYLVEVAGPPQAGQVVWLVAISLPSGALSPA